MERYVLKTHKVIFVFSVTALLSGIILMILLIASSYFFGYDNQLIKIFDSTLNSFR